MELTVKEIRTLQLALINMEDGLTESGIAKMKALSEKLEQEATRLTKRAVDLTACAAKLKSLSAQITPRSVRHIAHRQTTNANRWVLHGKQTLVRRK